MREHCLYRFYADDGVLLYVGITNNPAGRFDQHAGEKPWWHEVRGISMDPYPDRESVIAAEARAISVEHPRHNKIRPSLGKPKVNRRGSQLVWLCDICAVPIRNGEGYIEVDEREVMRLEQLETERDPFEAICLDARLLADLRLASWHVYHAACDPEPDYSGYWFDVSRVRSVEAVLDWTLHLMEKNWLEFTNWSSFARQHAAVSTDH